MCGEGVLVATVELRSSERPHPYPVHTMARSSMATVHSILRVYLDTLTWQSCSSDAVPTSMLLTWYDLLPCHVPWPLRNPHLVCSCLLVCMCVCRMLNLRFTLRAHTGTLVSLQRCCVMVRTRQWRTK